MSAISLKSISGITSITTPAGVDNQLTLHNNNTTEAVKLDTAGNLHFHNHLNITGVSTASNFKTGTSNLHNTGLNVQDLDVDGHTNLDNVNIAGITTFSNATTIVNGGYHRGIINSGAQAKIIGGYISGSDTLRLGESMYLTSGGLGLGDSAPPNFTGYRSLSIHGSTGGALVFGDDGTDEWEIYGGDGVIKIYDRANTTERFRITDGGKIGVNQTGPLRMLILHHQWRILMIVHYQHMV